MIKRSPPKVVMSCLLASFFLSSGGFTLTTNAATIASNLILPYRGQSGNFRLYDFPGQVILLEFFFATCPFCQAAAPVIHQDVVNYYNNRGGNNHGLPVTVAYMNVAEQFDFTDDFIEEFNLEIVADDVFQTGYEAFGGNGTPHFVVINGVEGSSSHQQWEIVGIRSGWPLNTPTSNVNNIRSLIDSVRGPLLQPTLGLVQLVDGTCEFTITGEAGRVLRVEASTDWAGWITLTNLPNPTGTVAFRDNASATDDLRVYRVEILP